MTDRAVRLERGPSRGDHLPRLGKRIANEPRRGGHGGGRGGRGGPGRGGITPPGENPGEAPPPRHGGRRDVRRDRERERIRHHDETTENAHRDELTARIVATAPREQREDAEEDDARDEKERDVLQPLTADRELGERRHYFGVSFF